MTNINFRIDAELKDQAEKLFEEMGLNMSTALNVFLKTTVRSGKLPFEVMGNEFMIKDSIQKKLIEAQIQAQDKNIKYLNHDEMFEELLKKHGLI